jgi:acetyltransferase EpsM
MIIFGAGNLGKHVIDQLTQDNYIGDLLFFDEECSKNSIYDRFKIIDDWQNLNSILESSDNSFFIAVGNPRVRQKILNRIKHGNYTSLISNNVGVVSTYSNIGEGSMIQPGCCISHNVEIGKSCLIHANTLIGHDVEIENFVTIGSNVNILKGVKIGSFSVISPNVLIYPNVKIGQNVFLSPGVIVKSDIADYESLEL